MKDEESLIPSVTASELNLTSNVEARIKNPLTGIPRHQLLRNVEIFAKKHGLSEEILILSKGAIRTSSYQSALISHIRLLTRLHIVAQSPADFETLDVLDDDDREIIRYQNVHKWSHPWTLYMTVIICSIGAATQLIFLSCLRYVRNLQISVEDGIKRVRTVPVCGNDEDCFA
jgi:hypothetical protein